MMSQLFRLRFRRHFLSTIFLSGVAYVVCAGPTELANRLLQAENSHQPIPALSHDESLTIETAYQVQRAYIEQKLAKDSIKGFKAGLTSKMARFLLGLEEPVSGILLASQALESGVVIELSKFRKLIVETEIGLIVGEEIREPLKEGDEFHQKFQFMVPIVEFVEAGFEDVQKLKAVDIIAANAGAARFIIGKPIKVSNNLKDFQVKLFRNGSLISEGKGEDAMGDPWLAARWLVNDVLKKGWRVEKGHILLTGSLGDKEVAEPGLYELDFQQLGKVVFEMKK